MSFRREVGEEVMMIVMTLDHCVPAIGGRHAGRSMAHGHGTFASRWPHLTCTPNPKNPDFEA